MENRFLKLWVEQALERSSAPLKSSISVVGRREKDLGPRWQFAAVDVTIGPASTLEIVDEAPECQELRSFGYPEWAVFGILDVLVVAEHFPLGKVRIVLKKAEYHPVDSSPMAFRHAGRDAGRRIIEEFKGTKS